VQGPETLSGGGLRQCSDSADGPRAARQAYGAGNFRALGLWLQLGLGVCSLAVAAILCVWSQLGRLLLAAGARARAPPGPRRRGPVRLGWLPRGEPGQCRTPAAAAGA